MKQHGRKIPRWGKSEGALQATEANPPASKGEGLLPAVGQIPGGNKAAFLPTFLKTEMDVAAHAHVLFFTEDCCNSMKCNNIGKKLVFMSFPPPSFLLG